MPNSYFMRPEYRNNPYGDREYRRSLNEDLGSLMVFGANLGGMGGLYSPEALVSSSIVPRDPALRLPGFSGKQPG
jgi:hypothetical protein